MRTISVIFVNFLVLALLPSGAQATPVQRFYSQAAREHEVKFSSVLRTELTSLDQVSNLADSARATMIRRDFLPLMDFLFGPLVNRALGSPQRSKTVDVDWTNARLVNGVVELPYEYRGLWLVDAEISAARHVKLPVPLSRPLVFSKLWKHCSDSEPDHQTTGFYWYFWDPSRAGCDQTEGIQYQTVDVEIGNETRLTSKSFPEYDRMIEDGVMTMTMGFGYVNDPETVNPETDREAGADQYRDYLNQVRNWFGADRLKDEPILQGEYRGSSQPDLVIGHRLTGSVTGKKFVINVVMAAGIDQMELFAKSFAHDHDDFFGWFGHSRVGSGFDAEHFGSIMRKNPEYYSISDTYQVIYWAGCSSYSYYTLPFFEFKGGTRNLDIIANGLPSYFSLNADNAMIATRNFLNWKQRPSYQTIVNSIEDRAREMGTSVLVGVFGDEDN